MKITYAAALFDMDGLLLDTERLVNDSLLQSAAHFKLDDMQQTFLDMIGLRGADSQNVLKKGLADRVALHEFIAHAEAKIASRLKNDIPVKNGVVRLLNTLQENGIPCAVASSPRTELVDEQLSRCGIRRFFQTITGGDQVINGKPDPEIYLKAATSIGVNARRCIAFEDSGPGTRAAIAAGTTVVQVPDMLEADAEMRANGHVIAQDIWQGAELAGLVLGHSIIR